MGKHYRQDLGFDGLNVEMKQHAKIELDAKTIPPDDITEFELDDEPGAAVATGLPNLGAQVT